MKTTIEISDALMRKAKSFARSKSKTLRDLIEESLQEKMGLKPRNQKFKLEDCSYGKGGLSAEFKDVDWPTLRDAAYGDRT